MYKYSNIQTLVSKLTENEALRTFYTLLLMSENEEEKRLIDARFWAAFAELPENEQMSMKADFKDAVKKLPLMTDDLLHRVKDYRTFLATKQAA
jgi:hypothetical protein